MEKEKDELPRERSYSSYSSYYYYDDDDDGDNGDNDEDEDEAATRASWKNVPGENMECPHLAQSVQFGDDNVEGSGCAVKDLPFVCAGKDSYKAPGEKESLPPILSKLERDGRKGRKKNALA